MALESLLTYRAIRQLAATHLQQQTLLEVAQVDDSQMVGSQVEVQLATQDLWTEITSWDADTNPYASTAAWVWEEIAQPESSNRNRQAVWWSDLVVALVIKAALRHLPTDPAISTPAMEAAQILQTNAGLFGLRSLQDAPHLFAKQSQLICTYATQRHQISAITASTSSSRYLWSTNTGHRRNSRALYFDASAAHHYGKFINDKWHKHANNCEFRWNPATGRVEVYTLRDIHLNEELGSDYDAPFWYQRHNGLTSLAQAQQVQSYYQQRKLPWYSTKSPHIGPSNQSANTPTNPAIQQGESGSQPAQSESTTKPPTDSTTTSPSTPSPPDQGESPNGHSDN